MRAIWGWTGAGVLLAAGVAGSCARQDDAGVTEAEPVREERAAPAAAPAAPAAAPAPVDTEALRRRITAHADSVDRLLGRVRDLSAAERRALKADVQARQLAAAQRGGVRASDPEEVRRLVSSGRLVRMRDTTSLWVTHDLQFSVPNPTPSAHAMVAEAARRFQARMDALGAPRYRVTVTSVLRTDDTQKELRARNSNAAAGVSTHEYGTTVDISYVRYSPPPADPSLPPEMAALQDSLLRGAAQHRTGALRAELGRVLLEMRREGKLLVIMERNQPVYHMTVARRLAAAGPVD
jgi:hypothetical protein